MIQVCCAVILLTWVPCGHCFVERLAFPCVPESEAVLEVTRRMENQYGDFMNGVRHACKSRKWGGLDPKLCGERYYNLHMTMSMAFDALDVHEEHGITLGTLIEAERRLLTARSSYVDYVSAIQHQLSWSKIKPDKRIFTPFANYVWTNELESFSVALSICATRFADIVPGTLALSDASGGDIRWDPSETVFSGLMVLIILSIMYSIFQA